MRTILVALGKDHVVITLILITSIKIDRKRCHINPLSGHNDPVETRARKEPDSTQSH